MRSLPETRSRRVTSDSKHRLQNLKRLKNGHAVHHVTTRSQAKITKSPKVLRKLKTRKNTSGGKSSLNINAKKNECVTNGIVRVPRSSNCFNNVGRKEELRRSSNNNCQQGKKVVLTNGLAHHRDGLEVGQKKVLGKNHNNNCCFHRSIKGDLKREHLAAQRAEAAEKRADRLKKRKSALWVLNCEAESFLFGETAAEDHEVELPPMSTPPKKRRRFRTNELGSLLKESPILGSKLRSPSLSSRSSPSKDGDLKLSEFSEKADSSENSRGGSSSESESVLTDLPPPKLEAMAPFVYQELALATSPTSAHHSNSNSNMSSDGLPWLTNCSNSDSVRISNILGSMEWKFSFEELPSDETWYSTFKRQQKSRNSLPGFYYPPDDKTFAPLLLPYETKVLQNRSPKKRHPRLPRKSPRCHASTLAILSSLKHRGHRHRADVAALSGLIIPNSNGIARPAGLSSPPCPDTGDSKVKRVRKRIASASSTSSPAKNHVLSLSTSARTPSLPPVVSPPQLTIPSPASSPVSPASPHRIRDLSATQYLWDSIQLLSDPYVIQILAGSNKTSRNHDNSSNFFSNSSNPDVDPSNNLNDSSFRKNSCGSPTTTTLSSSSLSVQNSFLGPATNFTLDSATLSGRCNVNYHNNSNGITFQNADKPRADGIPLPANSYSKNNFRNNKSSHSLSSMNCDNKKFKLSLNGKNLTVNGRGAECSDSSERIPNGITNNNNSRYRKASNGNKKSPVVLVADIFKNQKGNNVKASVNKTLETTSKNSTAVNSKSNSMTQKSISNSKNINHAEGPLNNNNNFCKAGSEELLFLVEKLPPLPAWPV